MRVRRSRCFPTRHKRNASPATATDKKEHHLSRQCRAPLLARCRCRAEKGDYLKKSHCREEWDSRYESGRLDLNQRPPAPEAGALPGYATPRKRQIKPSDRGRTTHYNMPGCSTGARLSGSICTLQNTSHFAKSG